MGQRLTVEHFRKMAEFRPMQQMLEIQDKDPSFAYRLVENTPEAIRYRKMLGYEIVLDTEEKTPGSIGQPDRRRVIANELVVMRRPRELHEMNKKVRQEKARQKMLGPYESFKSKAAKLGVEPVDESKMDVAPLRDRAPSDDEFQDEED